MRINGCLGLTLFVLLGGIPRGGIAAEPAEKIANPVPQNRTAAFDLRDGDRVVLLGGTYIERLQSYGYLETLLTAAYPNRDVTFRNLGWSGDDVTGIARAVFGKPPDGFQRLLKDVNDARPTVLWIAYGANEAYAGPAGVPQFAAGLNRLLDALTATRARIVLISPTRAENVGPPLPDPARYNADLSLYRDAIANVAAERNLAFVDFSLPLADAEHAADQPPEARNRLTDNGVHFTDYGYWRTAPHLAAALGAPQARWELNLNAADHSYDLVGATLSELNVADDKIRFVAVDRRLPYSAPPVDAPRGGKLTAPHAVLRVGGLASGNYGLRINDKSTVMADEKQWAAGVRINLGAYDDQVAQLRAAIREKNQLYFYRYRPENETYLFLFRKHEQGNNAVEIPQFDPLIAEQEQRIAKLRVPTPRVYEIVRLKSK